MQPSWHFFWSGPFSQWQTCTIVLDGKSFNCAEQAMMHAKAELFADQDAAAAILAATEPGRQKALGRTVRGFDEAIWDAHKVAIVQRISLEKFRQNKGLRRKLFQTGGAVLVEASPLDQVWGIGLDADKAKTTPPGEWPGRNLLGTILTEVKAALAAEFPDEAAMIMAES
ncbi:MAG TPA: NADAR family protein [Paracoccaceae bacterium]|nr:NADAR family protein [Paracoccaceae bacterium]